MRRSERCRHVYTAEITGEKITVEASVWVEAIDNDKPSLGDWQWRPSPSSSIVMYTNVKHSLAEILIWSTEQLHWLEGFKTVFFFCIIQTECLIRSTIIQCINSLRFWSVKAFVLLQLSLNSLCVVAYVLWRAGVPIHMPDVWLWIITRRNEWEEIFILPHSIYTENLFHFIIWRQVNPVKALLVICKALGFHHSRS